MVTCQLHVLMAPFILLQYQQSQPPSPLQLVPSLLASPTPSPAQPLLLGEEHCPPLPPSHGSTPVGARHQGLIALLTSPSTNFKCLMLDSTPAMSVCPHHSSLELRVTLAHSPSMCRVSYFCVCVSFATCFTVVYGTAYMHMFNPSCAIIALRILSN